MPEIFPDIYVHLSVDHLCLFEVKLRKLKEDLIQPTHSIKGLFNSSRSPGTMTTPSMPCGDLIYVQGLVVAVHGSGHSRLVTRLRPQFSHGGYHLVVPGVINSVCIHVLVDDHNLVMIYSNLSEHSYPIGFGPGVKANFHRVLLIVEGDVLKLTPASFIEINSIVIEGDQCSNDQNDTSVKSIVETASSLTTGPAALISELRYFADNRQIQLHCKVVAIYVLVIEKNSDLIQSAIVNSKVPSMKIPLVVFIMDDGSYSCCCWADNERAVTLLGSMAQLKTLCLA